MTQNIYGLGDYNTDQIKEFARELLSEKLDPIVLFWRRPDATTDPKKIIGEMPFWELPNIVPDSFAGNRGKELVSCFSRPQLEKIGADGDEYLKQAIKMSLAAATNENPNNQTLKEMSEYIKYSPAWQF